MKGVSRQGAGPQVPALPARSDPASPYACYVTTRQVMVLKTPSIF